jgi:hypothetical protein
MYYGPPAGLAISRLCCPVVIWGKAWSSSRLADFLKIPRASQMAGTEIWRKTLNQIPTFFGRLVFLASLRDPATGHYYHPALAQSIGAEDADRSLCGSHHQVFQHWLAFSLEEQRADLDEYLRSSAGPRYALPYRKLVPPTARDVERQLYLADLETLLELLKFEQGGAFAIPEA